MMISVNIIPINFVIFDSGVLKAAERLESSLSDLEELGLNAILSIFQ